MYKTQKPKFFIGFDKNIKEYCLLLKNDGDITYYRLKLSLHHLVYHKTVPSLIQNLLKMDDMRSYKPLFSDRNTESSYDLIHEIELSKEFLNNNFPHYLIV